jgi:hypothetical protein
MPNTALGAPLDPLTGEQLYTLNQLSLDKRFNLRRTYRTLLLWVEQGSENLSGDVVKLEATPVAGVWHSSLEAMQRFIAAQNSQTLNCRCVGGCLDGQTAKVSGHIPRVTSGQLIRDGKVNPNGGMPADHLYFRLEWVDKKGRLRPFLVWNQCEDSEQRIQKILEE